MFAFEKLEVWQDTMDMSVEIYHLTEQFSLTDQIRRAMTAVSANIAEGKDTAHFLFIAYSSLMETMNHLILAQRLGYIEKETVNYLRLKIEKAGAQISALRNYHQNR